MISRYPLSGPSLKSVGLALVKNNQLLVVIVFLQLVALADLTYWGISIAHWRHDSFRYMSQSDLLIKLAGEGRWINHLLVPLLRQIEPHIAWFLNMALTGGAVFLIARRILEASLPSLAIAFTAILFPGLADQNTWAVEVLPSSVMFLLSVLFLQRFSWVWLPILGILQFACISYYYYMLPLMVMPLNACSKPIKCAEFIYKGVYWGIGLIIGYLVASLVNIPLIGHYGIEISAWRQPHPATDFNSLLQNVDRYYHSLTGLVAQWLPTPSLVVVAACLVLPLALIRNCALGSGTIVMRLGYALIVALSPYLTVVTTGILVQNRSLLPFVVAMLILPFLFADKRAHTTIAALLAVAVGLPSFSLSEASVKPFAETSRINFENVLRILPREAAAYDRVIIDGRQYREYFAGIDKQLGYSAVPPSFMEGWRNPYRLAPAFYEAGFRNVGLCPIGEGEDNAMHPVCEEYLIKDVPENACSQVFTQMCIVKVHNNELVVRLLP